MPDPDPLDSLEDEPTTDADATPPGYLAGGGQMTGTTAPGELPLHGWRKIVSALHYAEYRNLWSGALVANVGSWMQNVARDWLILQLGGLNGKWWLGLNAFAEGIPLLLLLPLGGVLADRLNRRWILIITNAAFAMLAVGGALLAYFQMLRPWHILLLTAGNAAADGLRIPANQSMLPDLVAKSSIPNAIALNSLQFNISRVLGPAIGGLVLVSLGPTWSFSLHALSSIAIITPLLMVHNRPLHQPTQTMIQSLRSGAGYVRSRTDLVVMLTLVVLSGFFAAPVTKFLSAYSDDTFNRGAEGFTLLLSCFGLGAMIGAVLMALRSGRAPTPWRAFPILVALGACQLAMAFNASFNAALILVAIAGMCFIGANVRLNTAIIASTPRAFRGRTMSFHVLAFRIGLPLGGLLAGFLAQNAGLRWTYAAFGVTMMIVIPLLLVFTLRRRMLLHH